MAGRKQLTEDERSSKQQEIMLVVERMFAKKHPNTLYITMKEIASNADIAKGTLYLYFTTKEELIFSIYVKSLKLKKQLLIEALDKFDSPYDKYRAFLDFYYDFFKKYPQYLGIQLYCEEGGFGKNKVSQALTKEYKDTAVATRKIVLDIMYQCLANGSFKSDLDVEITLFNFNRALRGVIAFCIFNYPQHVLGLRQKCTQDEFYENFIKILLRGITG